MITDYIGEGGGYAQMITIIHLRTSFKTEFSSTIATETETTILKSRCDAAQVRENM